MSARRACRQARLDKREEARAMLAAIFGWFAEGFDTPYLKEAEVLPAEPA